MKYDGILFGNGMTLNLLQQLKPFVPQDKQYLLKIDDFLKCWIKGGITKREERIFYSSIYGNMPDRWNFFDKLKSEMGKYYNKYKADIEYTLGALLFEETEYKDIISAFPAIYNIWYIILRDYLEYLNLGPMIKEFYDSVNRETGYPQYIWTTNFDLFGETIEPEHIHGRFLAKMRKYEDIIYKMINNGESYYYKHIWGHNGVGKICSIKQLMQYPDYGDYFDFRYFFDNDVKMEKMLIYGMGFKKSGFIDDLKTAYPKYEKAAFGAIIDEHILMRVNAMQNLGLVNEIDITYFDDKEREHINEVLEIMMIKNYRLIQCSNFNFTIGK